MSSPTPFTEAGDSADLQALFDSISSDVAPAPPPPPPPPAAMTQQGDSADLQALFDSVASEVSVSVQPEMESVDTPEGDGQVYNRVGNLARQLHDSLVGLGYDQQLEEAASQIPDAQQRLTYVAKLTEQAANRVLAATEIARPLQDELLSQNTSMAARWEKMFANQLSVEEFKQLAADTRGYFNSAPAKIKTTNEQLTEILMAQDYQDLTGQVIKKVVELAQNLEKQLVNVLIETMPEGRKAVASDGLMNGPVISADGRTDVVTSQAQVDDLLESLGF